MVAGRHRAPIAPDIPPAAAALAEKLRALTAGVTVRELAEILDRSSSTVSRLLGGQAIPDEQEVKRLLSYFRGDRQSTMQLWKAALEEREHTVVTRHQPHLLRRIDQLEEAVAALTERLDRLEK